MSNITIDSGADQALAQRLIDTSFAGTVLAGTPETETDYADGLVASGQTFEAHDLTAPDEKVTDGNSTIHKYNIDGATVFIASGDVDELAIYAAETSLKNYLLDWDTGDQSTAEFLASFGFDGTPDEANKSAVNVRIWCEPNYFAGTLGTNTVGHYVRDDQYESLIFDTYAAAQDWIDLAESGVYFLSHGEAGRPAYTVCE